MGLSYNMAHSESTGRLKKQTIEQEMFCNCFKLLNEATTAKESMPSNRLYTCTYGSLSYFYLLDQLARILKIISCNEFILLKESSIGVIIL